MYSYYKEDHVCSVQFCADNSPLVIVVWLHHCDFMDSKVVLIALYHNTGGKLLWINFMAFCEYTSFDENDVYKFTIQFIIEL